ncbi:MAG TPA: trimethylamine methyltransferase family protein [Thermoleophilia bacterium]|nr:trimethylamine methyltransferase family protein [Thermoleophilia bacterium]
MSTDTTSTPTPDILWFSDRLRRDALDAGTVERLKQATFDILERVGVCFPSERALEIFETHGAVVADNGAVRLSQGLVERALATAPRSFVLAGREERFDLLLDGTRTYLCTEGVGVRVRDPETGQERSSRKSDVELMARVADALPLISFFWPPVSAQDHPLTAPLHECHAGLTNTLKHVRGATSVHPVLAQRIVEMATIVAGSEEARRRRPPICANICTISPLAQDSAGIEAALVYAEEGIPMSFMAMPTMGTTAPMSLEGAIALGEAEVVSAMVLVQLAHPGAAVFHSNLLSVMDPHSGGYVSEFDAAVAWLCVQLAHAWGVPCIQGSSLSSDAARIGWESGVHAGLGAALLPFYGGEIVGDMGGLLGGATVLEPHLLVLQHEAALRAREWLETTTANLGDPALDVIADVGPRGHYLGHRHTREHLRDVRYGPLHPPLPAPAEGGEEPVVAAARAEFARLAREHRPAPLPDDVLAALDRVLAAAERDAARL